jgi:hypothetical protein
MRFRCVCTPAPRPSYPQAEGGVAPHLAILSASWTCGAAWVCRGCDKEGQLLANGETGTRIVVCKHGDSRLRVEGPVPAPPRVPCRAGICCQSSEPLSRCRLSAPAYDCRIRFVTVTPLVHSSGVPFAPGSFPPTFCCCFGRVPNKFGNNADVSPTPTFVAPLPRAPAVSDVRPPRAYILHPITCSQEELRA